MIGPKGARRLILGSQSCTFDIASMKIIVL